MYYNSQYVNIMLNKFMVFSMLICVSRIFECVREIKISGDVASIIAPSLRSNNLRAVERKIYQIYHVTAVENVQLCKKLRLSLVLRLFRKLFICSASIHQQRPLFTVATTRPLKKSTFTFQPR